MIEKASSEIPEYAFELLRLSKRLELGCPLTLDGSCDPAGLLGDMGFGEGEQEYPSVGGEAADTSSELARLGLYLFLEDFLKNPAYQDEGRKCIRWRSVLIPVL